MTQADIVIIGGGPAGLSFAASMAALTVKVLLVEKSSADAIKNPKPDGREIALTHLSVEILKKLGVWELIDQNEVSAIKEAKVFDGNSPSTLDFKATQSKIEMLGCLVPNWQIRKALYQRINKAKNIQIITDCVVQNVENFADYSRVLLNDKQRINAKLVVAADSRFSAIRRQMGIASSSQDFSKVMILTKMLHQKPHHNIAYEHFDYGKTTALLPMAGDASSFVLTVSTDRAPAIMKMSDTEFNAQTTDYFKARLGKMTQTGERYSYPLVAVHAKTFIGERFALIGDAAVAMHPVTAHGFNLGLRGQDILADLIKQALLYQQDIGAKSLLKLFEKKHIRLTRILFFGTNSVVALFTNDTPFAKQIRRFSLKFAAHFPPIKYLVSQHLTQTSKRRFSPYK